MAARNSVAALRKQMSGFKEIKQEELDAERRREQAHQHMLKVNAVQEKLREITSEFLLLLS